MVTLAYAQVFSQLAIEWKGVTGGPDGLPGIPRPQGFENLSSYYWVIAGAVVLAFIISRNFLRSPIGRAARAIEEQPVAAQASGINVYVVKLVCFSVSAAFAALAGGLFAPLLGFIAPDSVTAELGILFLLMVLLGGRGTLIGPIIGAVLLFRLPLLVEQISNSPGYLSLLIYGALLILSVHFAPRGLAAVGSVLMDRIRPPKLGAPERPSLSELRSVITGIGGRGRPVLITDVNKAAGGVRILSGVGLEAEPAAVHALMGPNGAGKTTLLNVLSGFSFADRGRILMADRDITRMAPYKRARLGLGRTFQTALIFEGMTCMDNVMVALDSVDGSTPIGYLLRTPGFRRAERGRRERAQRLLRAVGLGADLERDPATLPPGRRRLLEIARTIAGNPHVLLMDEPAAGLNPAEIEEMELMVRSVAESGVTVILVEHQLPLVMRLANQVTVINFGVVIARGTPEEIRRNPEVVTAYLGSRSARPTTPNPLGSTEPKVVSG
jgi:ABC-type branched-subunit amino acid transport system ATPase component